MRGLDHFFRHFSAFRDQFVLIGGAACDIAFQKAGAEFRATHDIDIVLCVEALTRPFVDAFWQFVRDGGYVVREGSTGRKQFYRFQNPAREDFPFALELFSRTSDVLTSGTSQHLVRLSVEEQAASLSAILLDDDYYTWIRRGTVVVGGIPIVDPDHLVPLKARAWLDLTARKAGGQSVDSTDVKKHKNDVFRLVVIIDPEPINDVPAAISGDLARFLAAMDDEVIDLKALGVARRDKAEVIAMLKSKYGL